MLDTESERVGGHFEVGVGGNLRLNLGEQPIGRFETLQFLLGDLEVLGMVFCFQWRTQRKHVVVEVAVDIAQLIVLFRFLRMLEEGPNHPNMAEDVVDGLNSLLIG